jgi:hypothetical protein
MFCKWKRQQDCEINEEHGSNYAGCRQRSYDISVVHNSKQSQQSRAIAAAERKKKYVRWFSFVFKTLGAVNLDRHCGVLIAPSGAPCMRSISCKSHSLASKRAVIGRSKPFDELLAHYIAANPARSAGCVLNNSFSVFVIIVSVVPKSPKSSKQPSSTTTNVDDFIKLYYTSKRPFISAPPAMHVSWNWIYEQVKTWTSEPLRLFKATRKSQLEAPNK